MYGLLLATEVTRPTLEANIILCNSSIVYLSHLIIWCSEQQRRGGQKLSSCIGGSACLRLEFCRPLSETVCWGWLRTPLLRRERRGHGGGCVRLHVSDWLARRQGASPWPPELCRRLAVRLGAELSCHQQRRSERERLCGPLAA